LDTEQAKEMLGELFGIGPWWTGIADIGSDCAIPGEPFEPFKLKVSHARLLENTTIELLEPMGPSMWRDFLAETGGGTHHIAWDVANWEDIVDKTKAVGGEMLIAANVWGKKFCYMKMPTGLIVEWADQHIHADAEVFLRGQGLPGVSMDGGHIGTVVKDTDQAKELYEILGWETWWTGYADIPQEAMITGDAFSLWVSDAHFAQSTIMEMLQPESPGSLWDTYLQTEGGGFHHIAYEVPDFEAMIDKIEGAGGKMLIGSDVWGGKFAYMQLPIGLVVEIQTMHSHADGKEALGIPIEPVPERVIGLPTSTAHPSHIGLVVEDTEQAKEMLEELYGIGPWWTGMADIGSDCAIAGEPFEPFTLKVSHARLLDNATIELLEPMGPSLWQDYLVTTGGGIHHIAYDVTNWQEMVDATKRMGGEMLIAANVWGKKFCYMKLPSGLIVEWADMHIHADAEHYLRSQPLPEMLISHVGTVVEDTDQAKELLATFEIGPWWTGEADIGQDLMMYGDPFTLEVSHALLWERQATIELLEPMGPSLWADYATTVGGGTHHIAFDVPNWQKMVDKTEALGGEMLVAADVWGKKFCYIRLPIGLIVEYADLHIHADAEELLGLTD
jgi:catechol 2,3-dioxygenase-like lactoylglutathione lyase family enzyme